MPQPHVPQPYVAVAGPGHGATPGEVATAREAGRLLAEAGAVVLTGGGPGVMDAAAAGATGAGGVAVAVAPGADRAAAHDSSTVVLPTGLGELRNGLLVRSADAVLVVGHHPDALGELDLAVRTGVPVVAVSGSRAPRAGAMSAPTVGEAVDLVLRLAEPARG